MSVKCPACGFDSADDAAWCDFCKQPFKKNKPKPPPAAPEPDPLGGLTKDQLLDLPAEQLLRGEEKPVVPQVPAWVRPAAWTFLSVLLAALMTGLWAALARFGGPSR